MPKTLTAKVTFNNKDALKRLQEITDRLNDIQNTANKASKGIKDFGSRAKQAHTDVKATADQTKKLADHAHRAASNFRGMLTAVAGIMALRAGITASDTITSAENKFNYMNGGDLSATQAQMDAMYAASQRARIGYADMMSNVAKSMTLSPDAFQGDIGMAIRFQEIMGKSYTLAGASAAEMSSSMYQLIQGLGSGILQGDELRSVREGAPLAYKAIEEFAQGIYGADQNLKDLASQGKITSEIVVAAIMGASEEIESAFENTNVTIAQTWQMMKNDALQAFRVVQVKINEFLNQTDENGVRMVDKLRTAWQTFLTVVMDVLYYIVVVVSTVLTWIFNNWDTIKHFVIAGLIALAGYFLYTGIMALVSCWLAITGLTAVELAVLKTVAAIAFIVIAFVWAANTASNGCDFIVRALSGVALALIAIAILTQSWWLLWVALALAVTAVIISFLSEIAGFFAGLWAGVKAVVHNIGVAWNNGWNAMKATFWNFAADVVESCSWIIDAVNAVLRAFGAATVSADVFVNTARAKASTAASSMGQYTDVGAAFNSGKAAGVEWGNNVKAKIGEFGSELQNHFKFDSIGDTSASDVFVPDSLTLPTGSTGSYDPTSLLGDIADSSGKAAGGAGRAADSLEMAEEDLEYLIALADREWKKEFTTANIIVDMKNNNTINNQGDLDGWVTILTERLYEELDAVADGVYV